MIGNIIKLIHLLTKGEKYQALMLLALMSAVTFMDVIGVASVMPFVAILTKPELAEANRVYKFFENVLDLSDIQDVQMALGVVGVLLLLFSLMLKSLTVYFQLRFTLMREYSIGRRLLEGYLFQPYSWHLSRNSADLERAIFSEV